MQKKANFAIKSKEKMSKHIAFHAIALLTVIIWGVTFISTKVLINSGLTPVEIFLYRFLLAYVCILAVSHKEMWAHSLKDEGLMMLAGLCGGSVYFIAENTALGITLASNVSLIICTAPVITAFFTTWFYKEPLNKHLLAGSVVALLGVGLVVFNGSVLLKINPLGDLLTLVAATVWALYCILLKRLGRTYSTRLITRKVFFYGLVSLVFYLPFHPFTVQPEVLMRPEVYLNLLFLGVVASMLCYIMWNAAVKFLGTAQTASYIYIIPLVTLAVSAVVLNERITPTAIVGSLCIVCGVYWAERRRDAPPLA